MSSFCNQFIISMDSFPLKYSEPVFRPPSEAYSLILQVTLGCSWNKCSFCEMYTSKKFKVRNPNDVIDEIKMLAPHSNSIKKVFLADGDAMMLTSAKLLNILSAIKKHLPKVRRISAYAKPKDLAAKSLQELKALKEAGLDLVYVGIESGDNEILKIAES